MAFGILRYISKNMDFKTLVYPKGSNGISYYKVQIWSELCTDGEKIGGPVNVIQLCKHALKIGIWITKFNPALRVDGFRIYLFIHIFISIRYIQLA